MQSENPFSDIGFRDPMLGAEIFTLLKVSDSTLKDPSQVTKLQEIAGFLNGYEDAGFVVERALRKNPSKGMNEIDAILSFVKLHKERASTKEKLALVERELSYYE